MSTSKKDRKSSLICLFFLIMLLVCLPGHCQTGADRASDVPWQYIAPERDMLFRPQETVDLLGIKEGDVIVDFGASLGYFTFPLARAAGPSGKVYALDIAYRKPSVKKVVLERAADRGMNPYDNVELIANLYYTVPLPEESVDVAFMSLMAVYLVDENALRLTLQQDRFDIHRRNMESLYACLKPGGRLVVIDLYMLGDENDYEHPATQGLFINFLAARDLNIVKKNFESLGFRFVEEFDLFLGERFQEDVREFKKTEFFNGLTGESRFLMCNRKFFFIFEKPAERVQEEIKG